jgi:hypothetical protein
LILTVFGVIAEVFKIKLSFNTDYFLCEQKATVGFRNGTGAFGLQTFISEDIGVSNRYAAQKGLDECFTS